MTIDANVTWTELEKQAGRFSRETIGVLRLMDEWRLRWTDFKDARSDSTIATALGGGITTTQVASVRLGYEALGEIYDFANNVASPAQGDRLGALRAVMATDFETAQHKFIQRARGDFSRTVEILPVGEERYRDWLSFRSARNDATIATALSVAEADITALRAAFKVYDDLYDFANNGASPTQGDRLADMRALT